MIRALLRRGIRQHAVLISLLCLGLFLFEWAIVWVAGRIERGPGFQQLFSAFLPPQMIDAVFGQLGFASFGGAVSFGYQHPFNLIIAITLVTVMGTLPAHEREVGVLDLILSRPLPRSRYLAANLLLVALPCVLAPMAIFTGGALGLGVVQAPEPVSWTSYLSCAGGLALLLFAVGGYTLLFSTFAKRRGIAVAQAVGATLVFYWLDFMGGYWDLLGTARLFSPFHYFDPAAAARSGVPVQHALVLMGITLAATTGAFLSFRRQDL
jgi:ABC-type transport system involved in multi-copper enzyme maturation permease subunit